MWIKYVKSISTYNSISMTEKLPCGIGHLHNLNQTIIFQLSFDPDNQSKMWLNSPNRMAGPITLAACFSSFETLPSFSEQQKPTILRNRKL